MKSFLKILFLGVVIALSLKYLNDSGINVREKLYEGLETLKGNTAEMSESSNTEPDNMVDESQADHIVTKAQYVAEMENTASPEAASENNASDDKGPDNYYADEASNKPDIGTASENTEWVKIMTQKYSPDSWNLLMLYDKLPEIGEGRGSNGSGISSRKPAKTFHYLKGVSKNELLQRMGTNVHEIAHGYYGHNVFQYAKENDIPLNWNNAEGYIYLSPSRTFFISFPTKYLFPSKELVSEIPEKLRTFRFDTYVDGNTSTQEDGVVGQLNEFHAYFLGSRFAFEMLDAYRIEAGSDAKGLFNWVRYSQSSMTAYYEFSFFIKEYLLHMKKRHYSDYLALKSYREFAHAYNAIDNSYGDLIKNYQQTILTEMNRINESGKEEASMKDGYLWVGHQGSPIFSDDREKLIQVLESSRYSEIEEVFAN